MKAKQEAEARTNKLQEDIDIFKMQERIDQCIFDPPTEFHTYLPDLGGKWRPLRKYKQIDDGKIGA